MNFTEKQIESIASDYLLNGNIDKLLETMLNCLMKIERKSFWSESETPNNKSNGFREARVKGRAWVILN